MRIIGAGHAAREGVGLRLIGRIASPASFPHGTTRTSPVPPATCTPWCASALPPTGRSIPLSLHRIVLCDRGTSVEYPAGSGYWRRL